MSSTMTILMREVTRQQSTLTMMLIRSMKWVDGFLLHLAFNSMVSRFGELAVNEQSRLVTLCKLTQI